MNLKLTRGQCAERTRRFSSNRVLRAIMSCAIVYFAVDSADVNATEERKNELHVSGSSNSEPPAGLSKRAQKKWKKETQRLALERREVKRAALDEQEAKRVLLEVIREHEVGPKEETPSPVSKEEVRQQPKEASNRAEEKTLRQQEREKEAQQANNELHLSDLEQQLIQQQEVGPKEETPSPVPKEEARQQPEEVSSRVGKETVQYQESWGFVEEETVQHQESWGFVEEETVQHQESWGFVEEETAQRQKSRSIPEEETEQQEEVQTVVEEEPTQQESAAVEPESRETAALIDDKPSPDDRLREMIASYPLLEGNALYSAERMSEDGTIVVGEGFINGRAQPFIARDDGGKVGIVGLFDLNDSLNNATLYSSVLQSAVQTFVQDGMRCSSFDQYGVCISAGALYSHNAGKVNGANWQGEFSTAYRINDDWTAGLGYQAPSYRFDVGNDTMRNRASLFGLFAEYGTHTRPGVFARVALGYQQGDLSINRSYLTASGVDRSNGDTTVAQRAVSTQGGYVFAVRNASIMPYLGIDYLRTKLGDYTETSGQFPVRFNARTDENVYGTVGLSGHLRFTDQTVISAGVKHVQRLSRSNDPVSASVPGFDPFVVGAQSTRQWSEISVGGRFATPVKASSLDIGYRRRFASSAAIAQDMGSVFFTMGF
ncbi:autotransporter domain-containing protein [Mycetohabitans sp. B7]|nr:autotransporter domain-containing protein [Mycetohabitans sp. B7]MCG1040671.1 autotransporter domain-containing protein [Mycetohabitans sp. B7]